jgi:hypothetical protein
MGTVTVDGYGSETIDGELIQTLSPNEGIIITDYASESWAID